MGEKEVSIGRSPDNGIVIDNPAVSHYHARVFNEEGRLMLEDFGSLNGTFVNGQRVKMVTLKPGDSVMIGKHTIVITESVEVRAYSLDHNASRPAAPKINETVMLDTKERREFLQKVASRRRKRSGGAGAPEGSHARREERQNGSARIHAHRQVDGDWKISHGDREAQGLVRPEGRRANQPSRGQQLLHRQRRQSSQCQWPSHQPSFEALVRRPNRSGGNRTRIRLPRLMLSLQAAVRIKRSAAAFSAASVFQAKLSPTQWSPRLSVGGARPSGRAKRG